MTTAKKMKKKKAATPKGTPKTLAQALEAAEALAQAVAVLLPRDGVGVCVRTESDDLFIIYRLGGDIKVDGLRSDSGMEPGSLYECFDDLETGTVDVGTRLH